MPARVVTTDGQDVIGPDDIFAGQNVWQSMGGMEVGSVWGHGSYVAPDWTADWLHREADVHPRRAGAARHRRFAALAAERRPRSRAARATGARQHLRRCRAPSPSTRCERAAFEANLAHYADVFAEGATSTRFRPARSPMPANAAEARRVLLLDVVGRRRPTVRATRSPTRATGRTSRSSATVRPPTRSSGPASASSCCSRELARWRRATRDANADSRPKRPRTIRCSASVATPSQRAIVKYFWVVAALIVVQILLGVVVAHYGVEGSAFYGIPLAEFLPYSVARTWHVQLGIFWIATAWLAAGLFIGPAVSGVEPRWQRLGVNVLFGALLLVVVGSMAGEWLSVKQMLGTGDGVVLSRPQRLRVHRPRPAVADRAARRAVPLAGPRGARHAAGAPPAWASSGHCSSCS